MNKREQRRIEAKKRDWDESMRGFDAFMDGVRKEARKLLTETMNSLMYNKKERDKGMRFVQQLFWWIRIIFVFFALKGITFWLAGR